MRRYVYWMITFALFLPCCPALPEPDGCTPRDMRCHQGTPQVCSSTQRWTPADQACTAIQAVCCRTSSVYGGRPIHACVERKDCLEEPQDAGTDGEQ